MQTSKRFPMTRQCTWGVMLLLFTLLSVPVSAKKRLVPEIPPSNEQLRVIVDTDAACEIDDLYAIALTVLCPERFKIEGFVAAHYGDSGGPKGLQYSYDLIKEVLEKAGMVGRYPVKMGSHPFRYSKVPEPSEGVDFIIEKAMVSTPEDPLWVVSLGACTNLSAAYLKKPEIKNRVRAYWHGRTRWPEVCWNFNAYNDLKAVRILFRSELPLVLFDTGTHLYTTMEESKARLAPYGELGKFLHEYRYKGKWYQSPTKGFFDLGDIAALVDPTLVKHEVVSAPSVNWDMRYDHKKTHGKMLRLFDIDRDGTFELFYKKFKDKYGSR